MEQVSPHGGVLIQRVVREEQKRSILQELPHIRRITIDEWTMCDIECIATGVFSPLTGFMVEEDYNSVVNDLRLANGLIWSLPITFSVDQDLSEQLVIGDKVALQGPDLRVYALLTVRDKYQPDREHEAQAVYGTTDLKHPGVARLFQKPKTNLGGELDVIERPILREFSDVYFTPAETRRMFKERGWKRVVGFQTRNPIHRAHEYIQKAALETVDGLFVHPLVGETKKGDIPAKLRLKSYYALLENYFPRGRVLLGVFPAAMRYAGPREAVFHALVRKNYGCTHFIVGRDHAGVGDFYGTYDAQNIFDQFDEEEIGLTPLFFEHSFFCRICSGIVTYKTCPHHSSEHFYLSGTKLRQLLNDGDSLPPEMIRPEVADVLRHGLEV